MTVTKATTQPPDREPFFSLGPSRSQMAAFVRKVSSFLQVVGTLPDAASMLDRARPNPAQRRQHVWTRPLRRTSAWSRLRGTSKWLPD
jgi:hypothetical protein